jgi:ABC-type tungstate transport system permease subunit
MAEQVFRGITYTVKTATLNNPTLQGTPKPGWLAVLGSNNQVFASVGNDVVLVATGTGNDVVYLGKGSDADALLSVGSDQLAILKERDVSAVSFFV